MPPSATSRASSTEPPRIAGIQKKPGLAPGFFVLRDYDRLVEGNGYRPS
jgi:hypothetical protein